MSGSIAQGAPSATQSIVSGAALPQDITFGYYPTEGSRVVTGMYAWSAAQTFYVEDLSQLTAKGMLTTIQGVFIDNSTNADPVVLTINGSLQVIEVPANSQGIFPTFFTGTPGFLIQSGSGQIEPAVAVTRCYFLNAPPQAAGIWPAPAIGSLASIAPIVDGGQSTFLGATATGQLKVGRGRVATVIVEATSAVGTITINDAPATGTVNAGNTIFTIPIGAAAGTIYPLNFPFVNGLAVNFNGGATGTISVSWT